MLLRYRLFACYRLKYVNEGTLFSFWIYLRCEYETWFEMVLGSYAVVGCDISQATMSVLEVCPVMER